MTTKIEIKKLDNEGRGIGYFDDKIIFVDNALPGELVDVEVIRSKSKYSEGITKNVIEKSPLRVIPKCPYYNECGGCNLMHIGIDSQEDYKLEKSKDITVEIKAINNVGAALKNVEIIGKLPTNGNLNLTLKNGAIAPFKKSIISFC